VPALLLEAQYASRLGAALSHDDDRP
jgi:hypothetical protein